MPPPPPPSKSYLLILDSDSSDESDVEYRSRQVNTKSVPERIKTVSTPPPPPSATSPLPVECPKSQNEGQSLKNQETRKLTKNQKKKKRQRRKKKKSVRKEAIQEVKSRDTTKHVTFSYVSIRAFPRAFSGDAVPAHGGWPLGMKIEGYEDFDKIPVEEYETMKQNNLHERWIAILSSTKNKPAPSPKGSPKTLSPSKIKREKEKIIDEQIIRLVNGINSSGRNDDDNNKPRSIVYESRQWDYRSRVKNPLFRSVSEDERHALFLQASGIDPKILREGQSHKNGNSSGRTRSNSIGNHCQGGRGIRSRSNSFCDHNLESVVEGKFNEEYNQAMVHHVRNELEQIRFERNKSGATGCNCRKLVVYIPPKDGSGGKKAQHRRLKPSKVVQELKKRHLHDSSVASMSRDKMEKMLYNVVEKEPCCRDDACFCIRNGINCQADACSCWHDSHVHVKRSDRVLSNDDIRKRCGNPLGIYLVDTEAIDSYRIEIVKKKEIVQGPPIESDNLFCQFVAEP